MGGGVGGAVVVVVVVGVGRVGLFDEDLTHEVRGLVAGLEVGDVVVLHLGVPLVVESSAGVHEEVADCGRLELELACDRDLHLLGGALRLLGERGKRVVR